MCTVLRRRRDQTCMAVTGLVTMVTVCLLTISRSPSVSELRDSYQEFSSSVYHRLEELRRVKGCEGEAGDGAPHASTHHHLPTIYIITPTYKRPEQMPELTRLAQTLLSVPNIHWIVAEDSNTTNTQVVEFLKYIRLPYTYLLTPMPEVFRNPQLLAQPKGVANRNAGMDWVRVHATEGVLYFADDDNTYDIRVFEEMRYTKKVSMFPVGLLTTAGLSTPVLKEGRFVGWYDGWIGGRKFPVDMAGFAVSVPYLLSVPTAKMPYTAGLEETGFLTSLNVQPEDLEFLADNCTKIYVWHTKTFRNAASSRNILKPEYNDTNLRVLQDLLIINES
ncbi:galactosylgalactosylxylosylprotein 3-beta-glucuronosyltransferase P-like isoform X1 [Procambarus clarkii]|uniref:galactosylgalactosylxylosylprotein 3-beta-glucuronosyltransferase P-like isoform X1 n=1 Tax=Procambarus clarkii TaxID=6728 RepID=UPI003742AB6D